MLKNFEHAPNMCFSNLKEELIFCAEAGCAKTYTVKRSCGLQVFCRVVLQGPFFNTPEKTRNANVTYNKPFRP